jgi:ketosteroid isomerase-like protein
MGLTVIGDGAIVLGARLGELLRKRLYELYIAYAEGRIDDVLREFDDKVVMTSYAPVDVFPYLGRKDGKAAVTATMNAAHATFEYLSYQPVFMVTETEDAAVIVLARLRQRATGRIIQLFVADFLRFDKGRIVEVREFLDSFDAVQQVLGRELSIPKTPG